MTATENKPNKGPWARGKAEVRRFASDRLGSVAIEYIVAGALIGIGVAAGVSVLSGAVTDLYGSVIAKFAG
jgi:Flp pilus assembly pilin Flp